MGKQASKHAECFLVNAHLNKALEEEIWKSTKTGFNLANYNMNQSLSELSICLEEKQDNSIPLKVDLPPMKTDNDASKVLALDQTEELNKEKGEKEQAESRLNIEEFECGVQFASPETSGSKQEWSFTLYDFDGHGKITREDLASLLKALYDTVGSSIKIPSNGTKTLKLRLTVGQDGSRLPDSLQITQEREPAAPKKKDNLKNKENMKSSVSPKVKVKQFARLNNWTSSPTAGTVKCTNETQAKALSASKSRLSTHEQQQLAELVQENMERNHIKQLRRHHSDCRGYHLDHTHHKRRHRSHHGVKDSNNTKNTNNTSSTNNTTPANTTTTAEEAPKESQDRRNYYLDLAGIENNAMSSVGIESNATPSVTTPAVSALKSSGLNNTSKHSSANNQSALTAVSACSPNKHRSRSHENGQKCDNVKKDSERCQKQTDCVGKQDHLRSKSFDPQDSAVHTAKGNPGSLTSPSKHTRYRPVSLPAHVPDTVSPHYHRRHRHREKDHSLAMQQVAEWIEREHRVDLDGDRIVIQRHEHHHVHEHHHHHHYHHYYEA